MNIFGVVKDIMGILNKKCSFCGSRKNIKSTIILTFLYHYCDNAECRKKITAMEKRRRKVLGK